ncbi:DUF6891 domain-containing protein [Micromonospora auratinigra]|uniref:DUF6891 domain-containing protein n=1 Tax=Micromonospora auratinigra TaxID=261654 RepID=A0A1A9A982_9ACTN|nr:hypothetical protein [Micromonospora auratinigra]SBT52685.1 hypothetical protein GA0070611_5740 [Micromonospora auratinigra]
MTDDVTAPALPDHLPDELRSFVRGQVALAELPAAAIVTETVAYFADQAAPERVEALAWAVVAEELTAHLADQATWPAVTDSDRLTAAFRALTAAGIMARENFACCQNCGLGEIGAEAPGTIEPRGYAFYHQQDAERGVAGEGVHVAYGLFDQPPSVEIGAEVAAALRAQGLTVHWNDDVASRIFVPLDWRRRRAGRFAAVPAAVADDVEVDVELVGEWTGRHAPTQGPTPAGRFVALHLPWLPAAVRVRLEADGRSVTIRRVGDRLVGRYADPELPELTVGRHDGAALVRRLRGLSPAATPTAEPVGYVEVTGDHPYGEDREVAMELAELLEAVRAMRPLSYDFLTCFGRSGGCVQTTWNPAGLWVEELDTEAAVSVGRYATLPEVEQVLTVLAVQDRVAVRELGGELTTLNLR